MNAAGTEAARKAAAAARIERVERLRARVWDAIQRFTGVDGAPRLYAETDFSVALSEGTVENLALVHTKKNGVFWVFLRSSKGHLIPAEEASLYALVEIPKHLGRLLAAAKKEESASMERVESAICDVDDFFERMEWRAATGGT